MAAATESPAKQSAAPDHPNSLKTAHSSLETDAADFWLARGSIVLIAALQLLFVNNDLTVGAAVAGARVRGRHADPAVYRDGVDPQSGPPGDG